MAATSFLVRVFLTLIQKLPLAGDELDEATREHMAQRAQFLEKEMARLWQEIEQRSLEPKTQKQWDVARVAQHSTALQQWHLWVIAGGLVLLLGLCWCLRKRSRAADSSSTEERAGCNMLKVKEKEESEGEGPDDERDLVWNLEPVEEKEEVEEEGSGEEGSDEERDRVGIFERRSCRPVQYVTYSRLMVEDLVDELLSVIRKQLWESFYPVLQQAISVGTSFEGWFPCDGDAVHQLLLPLKAPRGHTFNLELGTAREMPAGDPRIRVELECTCTGQQMEEKMICFLHHSQMDITKNQDPSLLHTLCTGCYLDVHKTAHWFQNLTMSAWRDVPQLCRYSMKTLPSSQSCSLELTSASGKAFFIELIFGVRHGDSDIFLSSQAPDDTSTPSTTWPVTYAAAEAKFFEYVARQIPAGRVHLKCLHYCAHGLKGTSFSIYAFKTAVMHLLTTIPLSDWHSNYLLLRLRDLMQYMLCCLKEKCLKHFFLGNENVPEEIRLPPSFRKAEPLNLFQPLTQDPAAYAEALRDFKQLQYQLVRLVGRGH
ncbi:inositol 1,4,5-trisphosphate receptor-interacting protein-like 1 [Phaenicophaeus curvirostris]|uniref:inositol 1,4,5-trisphosphate receptor-interacting protein-like 1 n=1 Tax=Phaenicophaeus curvirostris TaxID=33595 RepID=UPI0037F0B07E